MGMVTRTGAESSETGRDPSTRAHAAMVSTASIAAIYGLVCLRIFFTIVDQRALASALK